MSRSELATCCAMTVGIGVFASWCLSRFDVSRIDARFDAIEAKIGVEPSRVHIEGASATVAIEPSASEVLREKLIEQFAIKMQKEHGNAL